MIKIGSLRRITQWPIAPALLPLQKSIQHEYDFRGYKRQASKVFNSISAYRRAFVAYRDDIAVGIITFTHQSKDNDARIWAIHALPDADPDVLPMLIRHVLALLWAKPEVKYIWASFPIEQHDVRTAMEAEGFEFIPREAMRLADVLAIRVTDQPPILLPTGYHFVPWSLDRLDALAQLDLDANRGTVEERVGTDMDNFAGLRTMMQNIFTSRWGTFDSAASVLVYYGDDLVGGIACTFTDDAGYILDLNVIQAHRRQGLARAMMQNALQVFGQQQAYEVGLTVTSGNFAARRLYENLGFQTSARFWVYMRSR